MIETGEPASLAGEPVRKMRAAMLADELVAQGAAVTFWLSTWEHQQKRRIAQPGDAVLGEDGIMRRYLHGQPYKRNVSLGRILAQKQVAADFRRRAADLQKPDLIYCGYPTMDLAAAAVAFGQQSAIPVIIDVRDMWPDIFAHLLPGPRGLAKAVVELLRIPAGRTLAGATAIYSITTPFLDYSLNLAGRARGALDRVFFHAYSRPNISAKEREQANAFWARHGLALDGGERILCFFGNVSELPNFQTAIAALDRLSPALSERTRLVICGVGDQYPRLAELGRRDRRVVAPGRVDRPAISVLMAAATAGLLPYPPREDMMMSYPNKVGEYLSGPLPIIATLDGVTGAMLRANDCGLVTRFGDIDDMAQAMEQILGGSDDATWKRAASRVYERKFDAEVVYKSMAGGLIDLARSAAIGKNP